MGLDVASRNHSGFAEGAFVALFLGAAAGAACGADFRSSENIASHGITARADVVLDLVDIHDGGDLDCSCHFNAGMTIFK